MSTRPKPRFYVDENLHGRFADELMVAGIAVVRCRDLLLEGVPDAVWIPQVTQLGLVIVTGDKRLRYRTLEKAALRSSGARVLFIRVGNARHDELARNFVDSLLLIERYVANHGAPWLVTLARPSTAGRPGRLNQLSLD